MLQGSQNYDLDEYSKDYQSDIDSKAIVLPHFQDFVYEKAPISATKILDNNEHIDIKDIRVMFEMFKKENISYIELLYTKYKIINPKYRKLIQPLFDNKEKIAAINKNQFLRCISGMSKNKVKALCHPYPNLLDKIKKYGYDGKQLSHCVRLYEFIYRYTHGVPLENCYISEHKNILMNLKKQLDENNNILSCEKAIKICNFFDQQTERIEKNNLLPQDQIDYKTLDFLNNLKYNILKEKFKEDINEQ